MPFDDIFQLKITGALPPMDPKTVFTIDEERAQEEEGFKPCSEGCVERMIKGPMYYSEKALAGVPDFALSQEWIGSWDYSSRVPFMSQNAYRLFEDNKIRGVRWYLPVLLP